MQRNVPFALHGGVEGTTSCVTTMVVAPHLDDAVFSVAEHMLVAKNPTVVCPIGGIPADHAGAAKMSTLNAEHFDSLAALGGIPAVTGPFLDDCYPSHHEAEMRDWLSAAFVGAREVWIPAGIHHPDHVIVAALAFEAWSQMTPQPLLRIYEELPYRVLYPKVTTARLWLIEHRLGPLALDGYPSHQLERKRKAVAAYRSQLGEDVERCLYVPERVWRVA